MVNLLKLAGASPPSAVDTGVDLHRRPDVSLHEVIRPVRLFPLHGFNCRRRSHPRMGRGSGDASIAGHTIGLAATLVMFFVFLSCIGLTYPNGAALGLAPFSRDAGRAMNAILLFTFAKRSSTIRP
jgi:hypothetical protein